MPSTSGVGYYIQVLIYKRYGLWPARVGIADYGYIFCDTVMYTPKGGQV